MWSGSSSGFESEERSRARCSNRGHRPDPTNGEWPCWGANGGASDLRIEMGAASEMPGIGAQNDERWMALISGSDQAPGKTVYFPSSLQLPTFQCRWTIRISRRKNCHLLILPLHCPPRH